MASVLKTRPHDALFAQTQFLKKPLHWGAWAAINDLLWLDATHRVPLARLRQLICSTQPHRNAFAEVIADHFEVDSGGYVHSPALTARHASDSLSYEQRVQAGRNGGLASVKARSPASAPAPAPAPVPEAAPDPNPRDF